MRSREQTYFVSRLDKLAHGRIVLQIGARVCDLSVGLAHVAHTSEAVVTSRADKKAAMDRAGNSDVENFGAVFCSELHDTKIAGGNYDLIYWNELRPKTDFPKLIAEARRLLQPGGKLLIVERGRRAVDDVFDVLDVTKVRRFGWLRPVYVIEAAKRV